MTITTGHDGDESAFRALFRASFGPEEGPLIGDLVGDLLARTPAPDLRVFRDLRDEGPVAGGIFTRLRFAEDPAVVFLLSPMAVAPGWQRIGIGQALLRHALDALKAEGVAVVMTYGDPAFYGRLGFAPVTAAQVPPPLPLSMPQGWIGQRLTGGGAPVLRGASRCVAALDRADIW
ncbi:GNAT family N-acetyltransferase [Pseudooceanicola sp. 200-1SW]|uniref:GNAT family N-acetyltransferase n=1 Tax=Pseudooceanicola sp. 200-1SW TaxID=3425949 RepID=UPI003D7FA07B